MSNETLSRVDVKPADTNPTGHEEAMAAKFDKREQEPVVDTTFAAPAVEGESVSGDQPERPSWLPEEFKSPEEFAEAYKKLSTKPEGQPDAPVKDPATEEKTSDGTPKEGAEKEAEKVLESKGLDYGKYQTKFAEKGALEDADYAELEAKGIPRSMVDDYVEGQKARAAAFRSDVLSNVGGEEGYSKVISWAKTNMSADEINAFNEAVSGKSVAATKLAVEGLNARYMAAVGSEPRLLRAPNAQAGEDRYESPEQLRKDMSSPDYKRDPAFRAKVARKLERSNIL